ncbi:MAG: hypothetical protein JXR95_06630 [Deltaproteobacteria bacterium]|nr:hypothetical protein [Deltaproteobacteria bacterium]
MKLKILDRGYVSETDSLIPGNIVRNNKIFVSLNTDGDISSGQRLRLMVSRIDSMKFEEIELNFSSVFHNGGLEAGCSISEGDENRIFLPYSDAHYINREKTLDRKALVFCPWSDDEGKTWNSSKALDVENYEAFAYGKILKTGNKLKMPIWGSKYQGGKWESGYLQSYDNGQTWCDYRTICKMCNETVIENYRGGIVALIRGYGIWYSGHEEVSIKSEHDPKPLHMIVDSGDGISVPPTFSGIRGTAPSLYRVSDSILLSGSRSIRPGGGCVLSVFSEDTEKFSEILELKVPTGEWRYGGYPVISSIDKSTLFVTFHHMHENRWCCSWNIVEIS